jgi:Helicase conserved C-terminal domain
VALAYFKKNQDTIFSEDGLKMYSPKFLSILKNIRSEANEGLHLIYSQFRSLEGIGILKLVLEANGHAEFKIQKTVGGGWEIIDFDKNRGKPKFMLYTGTESVEEKEILRNIYNSSWNDVPASIISQIKEHGHKNNHLGDVIKIIMITASGAEGINLKNTRFVHIVEPYWHMVRIQQVIGRARRICSHQDLPDELRTVKVFMYLAVLTDAQSKKEGDLKLRDVSKLYKKSGEAPSSKTLFDRYIQTLDKNPAVVSTDQMLFENALTKDRINSQILDSVKETAMDCTLYNKTNKEENLVCYRFDGAVSNAFASYPTLEKDVAEKDVVDVKEAEVKLSKIKVGETEYAFNKANKKVYNYAEYEDALASGDTIDSMELIGYLEKTTAGYRIRKV